MIDFQNADFFKLMSVDNSAYAGLVSNILVDGEEIVSSFKGVRDGVVFTNRRVIAINVQGVTGKKKALTSLPYRRIQTFSFETAGIVDLDVEMQMWLSGLGKVRFEFLRGANVEEIAKMISAEIL